MKTAGTVIVWVGFLAVAGCDGQDKPRATAAPVLAMVEASARLPQTTRLSDLPRQIRDYHRTTYLDDCQAMDGSRLSVREPGYVTTADFNGDGRPDYVLNGTHLECSVGATYVCGNGTCPFDVFVAGDQGYVQGGVIGHEAELERIGDRDFLMVTTRDGNRNRWGWTGTTFDLMPSGGLSDPDQRTSPDVTGEAIRLDVTFTPEAQTTLARRRERIVVNAYYSGESHPDYNGDVGEMGELVLGEDQQMLTPAGGQVVLSGDRVDRDRLPHIVGPAHVRITARGHLGTELSCDIDAALNQLSGRVSALPCDLAR